MSDLFTIDRPCEPLDLPDAEVSILRGIAMPFPEEDMLRRLTHESAWRQDSVRVCGKDYAQPRLSALYGDPGISYTYSGLTLTPLAWTGLLAEVKRRIEAATGERFNAVFLNLYRDERDSMGFHSDDERELGRNPAIASLTFGATRPFLMKHRCRKDLPRVSIPLEAGTVLLMKGPTQHYWKHGVARQRAHCGPRLNLTFRMLYSDGGRNVRAS